MNIRAWPSELLFPSSSATQKDTSGQEIEVRIPLEALSIATGGAHLLAATEEAGAMSATAIAATMAGRTHFTRL